jgi:transposase InsO family protein
MFWRLVDLGVRTKRFTVYWVGLYTKALGEKKVAVASASSNKSQAARELKVSRASLYYEKKIPCKDDELRRTIEALMLEHPGYGYRRVAIALGINRKRIQRVMQKYHLKPLRRAKTPKKEEDFGKPARECPDILSRLCPCVPNEVWVSDFTYIRFQGRFIYLATVLDGLTGEVLGAHIADRHDATFVLIAIQRAQQKEGTLPRWFHSDQGSEFNSETVAGWLIDHGTAISMSPKSSPWRNGAQESFFGRFKVEFGDVDRFSTLEELVEALYLHLAYFSHDRIKNRLKMSPHDFRQRWEAKYQQFLPTSTKISTSYESPPQTPPRGGPPSAAVTAS